MAKNNIRLLSRQEIAEGTMSFYWEKPESFDFVAGQFGDYTLVNPKETDAEGNMRGFSFITTPDESHLGFATRMRDTAFKRVLKTLNLGDEIVMDAPYGDLRLHNNSSRSAVFLTGGIGITPVHSIVLDATKKKLPHKIFLFYSNRRPEDAAFLKELMDLQNQNLNYTFIGTMTEMDKSKETWNGETGYISMEMIKRHLKEITNPLYYLTGPQKMVASIRKVLAASGVNDDDIKTEEFSGY
ncbi:MAG: FAD-dependent oxidoreductase [Ignavibacteria bacterium]